MQRRTWIIGGSAVAIAAAAALWWLAPGDTPVPPAETATAHPAGMVPLRADQIRALGVTFAVAEPTDRMQIAELPARIVPQPNARVAVAAQLPGVVTRILVVEGQDVRAGQPLATVSSRDMVSLTAELSRARSRQAVARAQAARLGQLAREGVIAPARADEAAALARQSDIDVAEQSRLIGLAHGGSGGGAGYTLSAPISGRISSMTAESGKALDTGSAPFVIDGPGALQVAAQLPERLIGTVQTGMTVRIGAEGTGTVIAVGSTIDPATRSASVTATVPASPGVMAGRATSVVIEGPAPAGALRVPAGAVAELDGRKIVFLAVPGGVRVQPVTVAEGGGANVVVTGGLERGARVATAGVSELKSLAGAN